MTHDYFPDDVPACIRGLMYKPITNGNLLAMLTDERATNGLVMPQAGCKWSALWMQNIWSPLSLTVSRACLNQSQSH